MVMKIFDLVAAMESELARLYRDCRELVQLAGHQELLEQLERQAAEHARLVAGLPTIHARPELDHARYLNLHGQVRQVRADAVERTGDTSAALAEMARTKKNFSAMYQSLSGHFREMADYYRSLAGEIDGLVAEEDDMRATIKAASVNPPTA